MTEAPITCAAGSHEDQGFYHVLFRAQTTLDFEGDFLLCLFLQLWNMSLQFPAPVCFHSPSGRHCFCLVVFPRVRDNEIRKFWLCLKHPLNRQMLPHLCFLNRMILPRICSPSSSSPSSNLGVPPSVIVLPGSHFVCLTFAVPSLRKSGSQSGVLGQHLGIG